MKSNKKIFRKTEISKICSMVAMCGFLVAAGNVTADTHNLTGPSSITKDLDTNSVGIYYDDGGSTGGTSTSSVTITLNPGIDLGGQVFNGSVPFAVFSYDYNDNYLFANATGNGSVLNLLGNNQLTGIVGAHVNTANGYHVADQLTAINLQGSDITFNNVIYAKDINFTQGGTAQFYGSIDRSDTSPANLNFAGHNATVTFHNGVTLDGNITNTSINGTLILAGNATITGSVGGEATSIGSVEVRGNNSVVRVNGGLSTDRLDYQALSATVAVGGNLDLNNNTNQGASNSVNFNGFTGGELQVGGNIVGVSGKSAVTTTFPGTGTVTMLGDGSAKAQTITGNIGSQGASIAVLNIGGAYSNEGLDTSTNVASSTTANGHVFANTVRLNNTDSGTGLESTLTMASGFNITGDVKVEAGQNGRGNLILAGGNQTVTGTVGESGLVLGSVSSGALGANSTFNSVVRAIDVIGGYNSASNVLSGTSNYLDDVFATNVDVRGGTSNFRGSLLATGTTTIGSGTGNFNLDANGNPVSGKSTTASIVFNYPGTANLGQGLTGTINFAGNDANVYLWDNEQITGAVSTSANSGGVGTGFLFTRGSATLAAVGGSGSSINELRINSESGLSEVVTATGDIFAKTVTLQSNVNANLANNEDSKLTLNNGINLTGNVVRTPVGNTATGILEVLGTSTISGNVGTIDGTSINPLRSILAGEDSRTATFQNGIVYAQTLTYNGVGNVIFRGSSPVDVNHTGSVFATGADNLGFVGTVDFVSNTAASTRKFTLGDNVDLITANAAGAAANTQTSFVNANGSSLVFEGNSVVTGRLGSANGWNQGSFENFGKIFAGATDRVVSFRDDVYVGPNTFHVSGTGTVNFLGNLNGPLNYDQAGTVNVADGKGITAAVTTSTDNTGVLNFVGSATTNANIGLTGTRLAAVNFHATTSDSTVMPVSPSTEEILIGHHVYATTTTIGNGSNDGGATNATITANNLHLGTNLALSNTTTLNTAGALRSSPSVSPVDFAHTRNADGTISTTGTVTQSTIGRSGITSGMTTAGATLNFAIGTAAWADPDGAGGVTGAGGNVNTATSSRISSASGSTTTLTMTGAETVNLSLLGSLRNGQTYTLIDVTNDNDNLSSAGTLRDNSFVITTALTRSNNTSGNGDLDLDGDLVVTATRADNVYITLSNTSGHFSNPAALRLGTLARDGSDYGSDMQTALNMLDIDQWGYGNNQANLAVQAKRLAPIANNSIGLSMFRTGALISDNIGQRMHEMRISEQAKRFDDKGFWIRSMYQQGKQRSIGEYDGFDSKISGFTMGIDARPNRESILGAALSYSNTKVEQRDFRAGDQATANAWHLSLYGAYDFTPELFIDGTVTASTANLDSARATAVARTANADTDVNQLGGKLNIGYRFKLPSSAATITPMLSYEGGTLKQDAYNETGAGDIGLSTPSQRLNWNRAGVGLRLATTTMWGGMVAKPELTVMAQNEKGNFAKPISSQFIGDYTNTAFTTNVTDKSAYARSSVRGTLGLSLLMSKSSSLSVRYDHTNGDDFKSNAFDLMARWKF